MCSRWMENQTHASFGSESKRDFSKIKSDGEQKAASWVFSACTNYYLYTVLKKKVEENWATEKYNNKRPEFNFTLDVQRLSWGKKIFFFLSSPLFFRKNGKLTRRRGKKIFSWEKCRRPTAVTRNVVSGIVALW